MKPYYSHAGIEIYHGDCRDLLPALKGIELILTDPPYGIAHPTNYSSRGRSNLAQCRDYIPVHEDDRPFDPRFLLNHGKARILWGGNYFANLLEPKSGWLVWDKQRPDDLDQSTCELAWSDCIKGVRRLVHRWHGFVRDSSEQLEHPTQKPVELMEWCLLFPWTKDFKVICDPFMGSGSTLVAAKQLGRKAIGIEIEERYCEIAAKRLAQEVMDFQEVSA